MLFSLALRAWDYRGLPPLTFPSTPRDEPARTSSEDAVVGGIKLAAYPPAEDWLSSTPSEDAHRARGRAPEALADALEERLAPLRAHLARVRVRVRVRVESLEVARLESSG